MHNKLAVLGKLLFLTYISILIIEAKKGVVFHGVF